MLKIDPDRLIKEELEYEISIRGVQPQGGTKDLVKTLRELLNLESEGHSFKIEFNLVPREELTICQDKLNEIEKLFTEEVTTSWVRKVRTKLAHVLSRIERIIPSSDEDIALKSKLLTTSLDYLSKFKSSKESLQQVSDVPVDLIFQQSLLTKQGTSSTPIRREVVEEDTSLNLATQGLYNLQLESKLNIASWGLTFSGKGDTLSLNAFFERVDERCKAKGITKEQLFRAAPELFEGQALVYFRAIREKAKDWDTLRNLFREEFFRDGNKKIWEQIKSRTQGADESIAIYIAYMINLFNRLSIPVEESIKLDIIRERIRPEYQQKLYLFDDINSLDQLIKIGRRIEDTNRNIANFVPPSRDKNAIEVDLQYEYEIQKSKKKLDNIQADKQVTFENRESNQYVDQNNVACNNNRDFRNENQLRENFIGYGHNRNQSRENSVDRDRNNSRERSLNRDDRYFSANRDSRFRDRDYRSRDDSRNRNNSRDRYQRDNSRNRNYGVNSFEFRDISRERYYDRNVNRSRNNSNDRYRSNSKDNYRGIRRDNSSNRQPFTIDRHSNPRENTFQNQRSSRYDSFQSNSRQHRTTIDSNIRCYKCKGLNHMAKNCTSRTIRCYDCGSVGYTRNTCIHCNSGNAGRSRR